MACLKIYFTVMVLLSLLASTSVSAQPRFLALPFADPDILLVQGPLYSDDGQPHGAGANPAYAFDFAKGSYSSFTWESFDVHAAGTGVAIQACETTDCKVGYGKFVLIRHDEKDNLGRSYFSLYAHMDSIDDSIPFREKYDTDYSTWKKVSIGDFIGSAGNTGLGKCKISKNCIHLHFEVLVEGYAKVGADPYDISVGSVLFTRDAYPKISFPGCGDKPLWTVCPPVPATTVTNAKYISFVEGNPGIPGDGINISPIGGPLNNDFTYAVDPIYSLADVTNGITVSLYSEQLINQISISFTFNSRNAIACSIGTSGQEIIPPPIDGVNGRARYLDQDELLRLRDIMRNRNPACKDFSLTDMYVISLAQFPLSNTLDAAAIGLGPNAFPTLP